MRRRSSRNAIANRCSPTPSRRVRAGSWRASGPTCRWSSIPRPCGTAVLHGIALRGLDLDPMIASYLLDATRSEHRLEDLALEHTSYKALTEEDVCGRGAKAVSLADVPIDAAVDYAGERADIAGQLAPLF